MSDYDYAVIVSTFTSMVFAEYQCRTCKVKYEKAPERQDKHQRRKGCFEKMGKPVLQYLPTHNMQGNQKILYYKCPALFYDRGAAELIDFHSRWESGQMMFNGGYLDQPAKFVESMELVHNLLEEHKKTLEKKAKRYGR